MLIRFISLFMFTIGSSLSLYSHVVDRNELNEWMSLDNDSVLMPLLTKTCVKNGLVYKGFWDSMNWKRKRASVAYHNNPFVRLSEQTFISFCALPSLTTSSKIPSILHFIWLGSPVSNRTKAIIGSWAKYHPNWEINVWTDEDMALFPWSSPHSRLIFDKLTTWSGKSDILRYEILNCFGGVYVDTDFICLKSLDSIVCKDLELFAGIPENALYQDKKFIIACGLLGVTREHALIKKCIERIQMLDDQNDPLTPSQTGPCTLSEVCSKALLENQEKILILPASYFYPLPFKNRSLTPSKIVEYIPNESYAIHLWDASWLTQKKPQ